MRSVLILVAILAAAHANADILRVDLDANPGGDGSTWGLAYDSLDAALAAADSGDQIWVRRGTYVPRFPAGRDATFSIPAGVQLYGGFAGGETSLSQRDPDDNVTELTGEGSLYTVVTIAGNNAIVDGFTISKGKADGTGFSGNSRGAGVYSDGNVATLRNILFLNHVANAEGAALALQETPLTGFFTVENCEFVGNEGTWTASFEAGSVVQGCNFRDNLSGAILLAGQAFHTVAETSVARHDGTATVLVDTDPGSFTLIDRCTFSGNTAAFAGGVRVQGAGTHEIRSSIFRDNEATITAGGGAVSIELPDAGSSLLVDNSLLIGNSSLQGGAINKRGLGLLSVLNSTIVGNTVSGNIGAGVSLGDGQTTFANSIVYGNIPGGGLSNDERASVFTATGASSSCDRSIIEFLGLGLARISASNSSNADPMFVDADGNDNAFGTIDDNPRLQPGSPAIDAGDNNYLGLAGADVFGQTRILDDTGTPDTGVSAGLNIVVDIGALEFQGTTPTDCLADVNGDGLATPADFNAWIIAFNNQLPACDQNGNGLCEPADFNAWIINFNNGCP